MKFNPFNPDEEHKDLKKKWAGTMVRVRLTPDGPLEPVMIRDFHENNTCVKCIHPSQGTIILRAAVYDWDVDLPDRGWFNTTGGAFFCAHKSWRQWQRGVCDATITLSRPTATWRGALSNALLLTRPSTSNFEHMDDAWKGQYPSFLESVDRLRQYRRCEVALSRDVALTLSPVSDINNLVIWYDMTPVGWFDDKAKLIRVDNMTFHQELYDFVHRTDAPCSILIP